MLLREEIFTRFSLVFAYIFVSVSCGNEVGGIHHVSASKKMMVAEIIKKVSNLTTNYLSKARGEGKADVLSKIEEQLKNTARSMGLDGDRYVELIMKGVKLKTFDDSHKDVSDDMDALPQKDALRTKNETLIRTKNGLQTKKELIRSIAKKLELLSRAYLKDAKTPKAKMDALEMIKTKVMKSAQRKHMEIHDKHADIKIYNELIAQGLEIMMEKTMEDHGRRQNIELDDDDIDMLNDDNLLDSNLVNSLQSTDIDSPSDLCSNVIEETCYDIQSLNKLTCSNGKNVPIETLCDGVHDCIDESDEVNCTSKVMEKLHKANSLISEVESSLSRKCIKKEVADKIISPQNQILRNVLQTQITFLEKYTNTSSSANKKRNSAVDNEFLKILNDVALVLGTLAIAFENTLCVPHNRIDAENFSRNVNEIDDDAADVWSPRSCVCKGQYCSSADCATPCNRVCWQKYSLAHWGCQASNGGTSISLDEVCDGKLDCFDETDENRCASGASYARFESLEIFKDVIEMLLEKTKLKEYESSRGRFIKLLRLVKQLQKASISPHKDSQAIKALRVQTFAMLVDIYEDILKTAKLPELDNAYIFLLAVNEKLVEAMKRSNTGNDVLLSPNECLCRDGHCALRRCSKKCIRACIVEPRLTRYSCSGGIENTTIAIDDVCNNINDCLNADDEISCKKEICRPHHIMVLRHNLRDVGEKKKGTALGEVLVAWRTKVLATLKIAENNHRITPKILADIINSILRDLVRAYSTVDDKGPSTDYIIKEFEKTAKIVIDTLKTCGK